MNADQIGGIIRAVAAAIGGYFVGKGMIDASTVTTLTGLAATVGVAIWSAITNKPGTTIPHA